MKLLFIYGSPAAGKMTVANEIAKRNGFKVFHNHLSIECVKPIFEYGTKPFGRLIEVIRFEVAEEAARAGVDIIYTFCYAKGLDDAHVTGIARRVEENGGEVCFVQLLCDKETLKQRAKSESRKQYSKAASDEIMDYFFKSYDLFSPVPDRETLRIDNTDLEPDEAAEQIIEYFGLNRKGGE
jgi:hypothetical protein